MTVFRMTLLASVTALAACANMPAQQSSATPDQTTKPAATDAAADTVPDKVTSAPKPKPGAKTVAELDTTTKEQRAAAAKPKAGGAKLGATVASLGNPTEPGFWIKTPLVKAKAKGRLVNPANGKSASVDLIPLDGAASGGSQVSLPALRLLGVSLTDLPSLDVYRL